MYPRRDCRIFSFSIRKCPFWTVLDFHSLHIIPLSEMTQPAIAPEKTEKKKDVTKLMLKEDKSNILVVMVNSQYFENSNLDRSALNI